MYMPMVPQYLRESLAIILELELSFSRLGTRLQMLVSQAAFGSNCVVYAALAFGVTVFRPNQVNGYIPKQ
jgi:hypothetical protein